MNNTIKPDPTKTYKLFLVEVDDDDRERVLSGLVRGVEINYNPQWTDIITAESYLPVNRFMSSTDVDMKMNMVPRDDGTVFTIENFNEEEQ